MKKVTSCIASLLPLFSGFILSFEMVYLGITLGNKSYLNDGEELLLILLFVSIMVCSFLCIAIMIYYMVKACKNPAIQPGMKVLWCVMFYLFNGFVFPIYWFIYIRNE